MTLLNSIDSISIERNSTGFSELPVQHVVLAGAQRFPRPQNLLCDDPAMVWPWLSKYHEAPALPPARAINCYFIRDLEIIGHDTSFIDGNLAVGNEMIPNYRSLIVSDSEIELREKKARLPCKIIEEPCFALAADGNVYGHFLIESMPRLHIVQQLMHSDLPNYKILIVSSLPTWVREILSNFYKIKPENIIEYDPENETVLLRQAIWPSLTIFQDHFHPYTNYVISDILSNIPCNDRTGIDRIFIRRAKFYNPVMQERLFESENELALIAKEEYGFFCTNPEKLVWSEQIRLFANANIVCGQYGSGLHNAIFSKRTSRVAAMGFGNLVQSSISALRQQRIAYITTGNDDVPFVVSPDQFRNMLNAAVN